MYSFTKLLSELASDYGAGITFIDIDETIFHTKAKIDVIDNTSGKIVKKLDNQQYNTFSLSHGQSFGYSEFGDAKRFRDTSVPIVPTIKRIKRIFKNIDKRDSKVVFLTARAEFDDPKIFLSTFKEYGIPIDKIDVQLAGNIKTGTVASSKKIIILRYLSTGLYRRARLLDDAMSNIKMFIELGNNVPKKIIDKVKNKYSITGDESLNPIEFYALLVKPDGSLKRIQ